MPRRPIKPSRSLLALAGFGAVTAGAAWYGARHVTGPNKLWYRQLDKPGFTPPDKTFPIVWSALYSTIAWSGWRVWSAPPSRQRSRALRLWASQLATNAQWSKLFFGRHRPDLAMADIVLLESTIARYIASARKVDPAAAYACLPYLVWVGFATALNYEIDRRNPRG